LLHGPLESVRAPRQYRGMATYLALLRGINVGGHKKIPMGELRKLCEELGYTAVQTYIQSGNVIFAWAGPAKTTAAAVETALEKALAARFGFAVDVLVRTAKEWPTLLRSNPFPEAALHEPQHLMMALAKRPLSKDCAAALRERAKDGEEIAAVGEVLWINYGGGMARSKLSPALIDRLAGSPVTARNLRTVQKLMELCADAEANQR